MAGVTASLRFPGKLNGDLRKLGVNLVPFPRLHFFLISQAPLASKENQGYQVVDEKIDQRQKKNGDDFVEWIPNNMKTSIVEIPPKDYESSCTFVSNTTALKGIFQRLATQFGAMYKRKAFLHWYKG